MILPAQSSFRLFSSFQSWFEDLLSQAFCNHVQKQLPPNSVYITSSYWWPSQKISQFSNKWFILVYLLISLSAFPFRFYFKVKKERKKKGREGGKEGGKEGRKKGRKEEGRKEGISRLYLTLKLIIQSVDIKTPSPVLITNVCKTHIVFSFCIFHSFTSQNKAGKEGKV